MKLTYSIIVISYYKSNRLKKCLESVAMCLSTDDEIIIIDNSVKGGVPHEETRGVIRWFAEAYGSITTIKMVMNEDNVRFSRAVNQGIAASKNESIFLVNNDIEVIDIGTFRKLAEYAASDAQIATVTPVTVKSNGSVYCSGAYGTGVHYTDKIDKPRQTEWNNFAFVCIKKEVIEKIGSLETGKAQVGNRMCGCRHFHSDEEWCRRALKHKYKHMVFPITVKHFHKEDRRGG